MLVIGQAALLVSLVAAAWALCGGFLGGVLQAQGLTRSAGRGLVASGVLLTLAVAGLLHALLTNDFSVQYVFEYSSRAQPLAYKVSALWAGMSGSLLFWAFLLGVFSAIVVVRSKRIPAPLLPWTYATMGATTLFFAAVTAVVRNPFKPLAFVAPDGNGMNPLLQNFWMMIHPPTLYFGYVGCAVPFAVAIAALATGRTGQEWIRAIRGWTLFAFAFLSLGIWLGGYWAYIELGWGGFWAWDPVENASLMPWLTLTAFVHSIIGQDRRGVLKTWNIALIIATFALTIFGTYLTRSGIIQSVHAFEKSSIGYWFLGFLALAGVVSVGLMLRRIRALKAENAVSDLLSREFAFLMANLMLVGLTILVFWLTMYPVTSELLWGAKIEKQPPEFTATTRPLFLALVALMALAPLFSWKQTPPRQLLRGILVPGTVALVALAVLFALGAHEPWSLLFFAGAFVVSVTIAIETVKLLRSGHEAHAEVGAKNLGQFLFHHRRRLGAWLSHFSVALMVVGIAASLAYKTDETFEAIKPGTVVQADGYTITYKGYDVVNEPNYDGAKLRLEVARPGSTATELVVPERRVYGRTQQPSTEVAILSTLVPPSFGQLHRIGEDFYVIPAAIDLREGAASIEVIVHPMINLLWLGGALLLVGTLVAAWPDRRQREGAPANVGAPVAPTLPQEGN